MEQGAPGGSFFSRNRFPLVLLFLVLSALAVVSLTKFGTALFILPLYLLGTQWVADVTGLNLWLARAIALTLIIPLLYLMRWMFSWRTGERRLGMSIFCGAAALICVGVFAIRPMDPAKAYYCIHPVTHRIILCDRPGTDPQFGMQLLPASPMIVAMAREGKSVLDPSVAKFEPETGSPLFGYLQAPDGAIRLYPLSQRYDPQTGRSVDPLIPSVAERLLKAEQKLEFKQCIECGSRNGVEAKFCHTCGRPL